MFQLQREKRKKLGGSTNEMREPVKVEANHAWTNDCVLKLDF